MRHDNAKMNMAPPPATASWYRLHGVSLDNATEFDDEPDNVAVVVPWEPPQVMDGMDMATCVAVLEKLAAGLEDGGKYSPKPRADKRSARHAFPQSPVKSDKQIQSIIEIWIKSGVIEIVDYADHRRPDNKGIVVNTNKVQEMRRQIEGEI
jgi:hypothetical protein